MSLSDFFKQNKGGNSQKSYVSDGVHFQSRSSKSYTNVEECGLAMNCIRVIQNEIVKCNPRHEIDGISQNDDITNLFKKPNLQQDLTTMLKYVIHHYLVNNNAYILKIYNKTGDIAGLLPISPSSAEFLQDTAGNYFYRFKFSNSRDIKESDVEAWRVIHLKRDVTDDFYFGSSTWGSQADLLDLVNTYRTLSENLKESTNTTPTIIFEYDEFAKASDYERDAKSFMASVKKNGFGFVKPHQTIKDTQRFTATQVASVEMLKYYKQEICSHFGLSEKILNNTATEEEYRAFYNRTIKPILQELSIIFTNAFFTATQQKKGHKIVFAQDDISLLSYKERIETFKSVQHSSAVKVDEQRQLIGYPKLPDGAGDVIMVQLDAVREEVEDLPKDKEKDTDDVKKSEKEEVSEDE